MRTITPISITAEGEYAPNLHRYRVRFQRDTEEQEFAFTVDDNGITGVRWDDDEFWRITCEDPKVTDLMQALIYFHEARKTLLA
ncbi:hypothetical protein KBI23_16380 [bacterium]|nr:hypothetical protein [bacterium]MBP9806812.1 hypothetical protein [bacterium]